MGEADSRNRARRIPEAWRLGCFLEIIRLSEGICPIHCTFLDNAYCRVCDCKWSVHTTDYGHGMVWTIQNTRGRDKQWLSGSEYHLRPPPFPG